MDYWKFTGILLAVGIAEIIWAGLNTLAIFRAGVEHGMKLQRQIDLQRKQNKEWEKIQHG